MKDTEFYQRPKEELLISAKESQKNAQALFDVARSAAENHQYGIANSLMILSVEECIKSYILVAGYFNVPLPFEIEPYFKDHKTKHGQAAEIQPLINFLWSIKDYFSDILKNRKSSYGTVFNLTMASLFTSIGIHFVNWKPKEFTQWWDQANKQKNNGFYVGFFDGKWTYPSTITDQTFQITLSMAKPFVECLQIVHHLRPGDYLELTREFSREEIAESEIKLIADGTINEDEEIDLSEYKLTGENNIE